MFKPVDLKPDFPAKEKERLSSWYENGIVEKYLHKNDAADKHFSFFDGPITANNPMAVHHVWGRTYKDLWQRYKNMQGFKQRFQNGFDCQGLWVEVEVEKELGIKNKQEIENLIANNREASIAKFVELCKLRVLKFSEIQTQQSKRLAYFMNWDNSYFTMSDENNYMIWHFLKVCNDKGWIYKGKDNVPWCPRCQTAISQHEMLTEDYKELTHETVFFKLRVVTKNWDNISLLVWTTTPWTIPANVGVGVNKKFTYGVWKENKTGEKIIIVYRNELGNEVDRIYKNNTITVAEYVFGKENAHNGEYVFEKEISGKDLIGLTYIAPFDFLPIVQSAKKENENAFHTVLDASEIVVSTEGTGLLHVAPGCGKEDFDLAQKYKLPIISPIDDEAFYVPEMGEYSGKNAKKHPEIIINWLKTKPEFLLKTLNYTHRYPACWRCKTELVWKVTKEWYIAMDMVEKNGNLTLREQMKETAKKITWYPSFGLDRELDWLANMHDWLISKKNRYWGLALPIYECQNCGKFQVIGGKDELKEKAVSGWNKFDGKTPHKPYIDEVKIKCDYCNKEVSRINDVGNVWLDAGIIPFSTLVDPVTQKLSYITDKTYFKDWFPADFITESFPGQFKNWFYSLIAMSTVLEKTNPFKAILGYASVLGEDGRSMHKSWGNAIEFNEAADKIGVDVMRLMYAKADTESNLLFGYKKADEVRRKFFLMLWNVYNFFVTYANIDKWEFDKTKTEISENLLDKWILSLLNNLILKVEAGFDNYNSQVATNAIEIFLNNLSLWYIRRSRDRLGPSVKDSLDKASFYNTSFQVLVTFSQILAPIMPFISEEIYVNLTHNESVHLTSWPKVNLNLINEKLETEMSYATKLASMIHSFRKENNLKVRTPIKKLSYQGPFEISQKILKIVLDEVNLYELSFKNKKEEYEVSGKIDDNNLDLLAGQARDIVRKIQEKRKELGTSLIEKIDVVLPSMPVGFDDYIKQNALVENLILGQEFEVRKIVK